MNNDSSDIEFSGSNTPLEKIASGYLEDGGTEAGLRILNQAIEISDKIESGDEGNEIASARETIRRDIEIGDEELDRLGHIAGRIGEESPSQQYGLMELVQAATVACGGLIDRGLASQRLADAASSAKQYEAARQAYGDAIECLQIMMRLFSMDQRELLRYEQGFRKAWDQIRECGEGNLDILEVRADPAAEWMELLLWNSDIEGQAGLISQCDVMLRLTLRFEYWLTNHDESIGVHVKNMLDQCEALTESGDEDLLQRCIITIGDALLEVHQWQEAVRVFTRFLEQASTSEKDPMHLHAISQGAYCCLKDQDMDQCQDWLSQFPLEYAEVLSDKVVTIAAERARLLAVEQQHRRKCGQPLCGDALDRIRRLRKLTSIIACEQPSNRTEYLRTLFHALLVRDLREMMRP